jgi:hypothetical protein
VTDQVLHIDFVALAPDAGPAARDEVIARALDLRDIRGVIEAGAIAGEAGSEFDIAVFWVLEGFACLEPFGTDVRYVRFLQGTVAPRLKAFAGADVSLAADYGGLQDYAACLALEAPPETYDWEVRERLVSWAEGQPGERLIGLAVGERQRYRGLALVSAPTPLEAPRGEDGDTGIAGRTRRSL